MATCWVALLKAYFNAAFEIEGSLLGFGNVV